MISKTDIFIHKQLKSFLKMTFISILIGIFAFKLSKNNNGK